VGERKRRWVVAAGLYYGQVKKLYRRHRLVGVEYRERLGAIADIKAKLHDLGVGRFIHTAFVERLNLTMRQRVSALIRRTWARAESAPELALHLEWWRAYYHFVRYHQALRVALAQPLERGGRRLPQRYRSQTPATPALARRCKCGGRSDLPLLDGSGIAALPIAVRHGLTCPIGPNNAGRGPKG